MKGTAKAIAIVRPRSSKLSHGTIKVNKKPLLYYSNNLMALKFNDSMLAIGPEYINMMKIDIKVTGGGSISKIYAINQAFCKASVAFLGKCNLLFIFLDTQNFFCIKEFYFKFLKCF